MALVRSNIQVTIWQNQNCSSPRHMPNKNVQKRNARPKRSTSKPGPDGLGLWVDYELLRKHQGRPPEILLHGGTSAANNRYLKLADLALAGNKPKKKAE